MIFDRIARFVLPVAFGLFGGGGGRSSTTYVTTVQPPPPRPRPTSEERAMPFQWLPGTAGTPATQDQWGWVYAGAGDVEGNPILEYQLISVGRPGTPGSPARREAFDISTTGRVEDPSPTVVRLADEPHALERALTRTTALTPVQALRGGGSIGDLDVAQDAPLAPVAHACAPVCCCPTQPAKRRPRDDETQNQKLTRALARARNAVAKARADRCVTIINLAPGSGLPRRRKRRIQR